MYQDPIVEEVRNARDRIFYEECGGDWKRLVNRLKAVQQTMKNRVITKDEFDTKRRGPVIAR